MKKFYIITNKAKDADYSFTKEIEQYLQKNGSVCLSSNQEQTGGGLPLYRCKADSGRYRVHYCTWRGRNADSGSKRCQ